MDSSLQIRISLNSRLIKADALSERNTYLCIVGDTINTASRMEYTPNQCLSIFPKAHTNWLQSAINLT